MAADQPIGGRASAKQGSASGFQWVSPSPSPEMVKRLEVLFPEVVVLPEEEIEAETADWHQMAVIARSFHRWIPAEAFIREFRRAGVQGEIQAVSLAFRCHVFRFATLEARDLVLQRPWVVNGQAIGTEVWRPEFSPAEDAVSSLLIWVRLPNLPLEFWKVEFIKTILASAGEFICIDSATATKSRGAFARACLRVDLRRPLRPGVRVQGLQEPFWQQFSFESLQGICDRCGMLHLGAHCSASAVAADVEGVYGPWIAAVRQRKPGLGSPSVVKGRFRGNSSMEAPSAVSGGSQTAKMETVDGWQRPRQVARRRNPSSPVMASQPKFSGVDPSMLGVEIPTGTGGNVEPLKRAGTVAGRNFQRATVSEGFSELENESSVNSLNPFAILQKEPNDLISGGNRDVCPGPLKRSRPESYPAPRHSPTVAKGKGKGKSVVSRMGGVKVGSSHRVILIPGSQDAAGPQESKVNMVEVSQAGSDLMGNSSVSRGSHQVEQGVSGETDSVSPAVSQRHMSEDGLLMVGGHTECSMLVDQGVALVSPTL